MRGLLFCAGKEGGNVQILGKVLWWDERDQNGIIRDVNGNKFYFDSSVLLPQLTKKVSAGLIVRFEINPVINECRCACRVATANVRERARVERNWSDERQIDLF